MQYKQITHNHTIVLNAPPADVFPLLTPEGEKLWVEGWDPLFLHPASGETRAGLVFTTGAGPDFTCWCLADYDPVRFHARYARVTPASRFGWVVVSCTAAIQGQTRAQVTYTYTALTEAGNEFIDQFTEAEFRRMIDGWQTGIDAYLSRRPAGAP